ncbi:uncharacterized protein LOC130691650 isoform X2 [Daphnia carinata]|uniref:uncharacterized protein LOC130691650 isoform X2 n=1 Tax=Daphnia carinata TaxID=120202 RepID=UPI002868F8B7|nr:uncharacterized protein LOC130691650 isoform X2 [Daphnia carinata]
MESYSLIFLSMLVYCSLILNHQVISVSARRNDKLWSKPFDLFSSATKFRKPEIEPKKDFALMAFHPDDLKNIEQPVRPQQYWEDRSSEPNRFQPPKFFDKPFLGVKLTTPRTNPSTKKINKSPDTSNEIHVQIDDVADLTNILGNSQHYENIVLSIDQSDSKSGNAPEKDESPKPFWGPPIGTPPTPRPAHYHKATSVSIEKKEEIPVRLPNNAVNTRQKYRPQSYHQPNSRLTTPERLQENLVHMQSGPPYYEKVRENDPFDQSFWHRVPVTEPTVFPNPISPQSYFHQKQLEDEIANTKAQLYSGGAPNPIIIHKEIDSVALPSYPSPYYPPSPPEHHVVYHHPAPAQHTYHHAPSGFAQVDFSPIFLAIVPIALFLGAAAAFALATATTSSSAAAVAQQQQQQEESSNSNNAANNNNANNNNALLAALFAALQSKHDDHKDKHKIIIITTTTEATTTMPPPTMRSLDPVKLPLKIQTPTLPPDKPLSEEDDTGEGFDQPGGGTVIEPLLLEEEEPEILTYDL